jgi:uncharacterized protein (DUF58 family)
LANSFVASILGTGPGRGIGLAFVISSLFLVMVSIVAFANPRIRRLEIEIPDAIPDEAELHSDALGASS